MSPGELDRVREIATVAHEVGQPGSLANYDCAVAPGKNTPVVTPELARAQVIRLLPHPTIGVAPVDHITLVHIDTLFWASTSADLNLGTVTLLGQRVSLRAHLNQVAWTFGDGTSAISDGPGKAYTAADPCRTVKCPDYFSHTYDKTGHDRVGAQLTWAGQFRVGGGPWQDIAETVPVESPTVAVDVRAARSILVPNP